MKTLALKDVEVHLGGVHILHDVTFEVDPGQVFGIVGPNGAGKTTILNVIGGVVRPTAGTVPYGDADLIGVRPYKLRELGIGRSLQSTHYFRDLTALQLVALAHLPPGGRSDRAAEDDARLAQIRKDGVGVSNGGWLKDVNAVVVPVFDKNDRFIGVLSCFGPASRLTEDKFPTVIKMLTQAARQIRQRLI